jgi:hypothetical protein
MDPQTGFVRSEQFDLVCVDESAKGRKFAAQTRLRLIGSARSPQLCLQPASRPFSSAGYSQHSNQRLCLLAADIDAPPIRPMQPEWSKQMQVETRATRIHP